MRIGIIMIENEINNKKSLVNVVNEHIKMFLSNGITVKLIINDDCEMRDLFGSFLDKRLEWGFIEQSINGERIRLDNYKNTEIKTVHSGFFDESKAICESIVKLLDGIDICFLHDLFYQGRLLLYNIAIRQVQELLPNMRFIAFTHSIPYGQPREMVWPFSAYSMPMPNTKYIALSGTGIPAIADLYKIHEHEVSIINNCIDSLEFLRPEVKEISNRFNFLSSDIFIVYPSRLMTSKRFGDVAALAGAFKRIGIPEVKVLFCDMPSSEFRARGIDNYTNYLNHIREIGFSFGLGKDDMAFASDLGFAQGLNRAAVLDLFTLSNVFVFPSVTEAFGLILLEAASRGNYLVLNANVPVFNEVAKDLNAYFIRWDEVYGGYMDGVANIRSRAFLENHAKVIWDRIQNQTVIKAKTLIRKKSNISWIWENQMKPVLYNWD